MMPTMCAEASAYAQTGAMRQRRRLEDLRRAAAAIRADVDACQFTVVAPHNGRRSVHSAVHTSRRRDAR
jgi:hypothetical protein